MLLSLLLTAFLFSCGGKEKKLPVLGEPVITGNKTEYPAIATFRLTDQDSATITNETFSGKIYVADFIFLSCPTICPKMTRAMQLVYEQYKNDGRVAFLSHTIDPEHDTIPRLKSYVEKLGVRAGKWHFVTGNQDSIYQLSEKSYFSAAYPDSTSPGGFTHSGGLLLVDKERHIRGVYNTSKEEETTRLINDIQLLLKEQF